jgi:hypothetical protein
VLADASTKPLVPRILVVDGDRVSLEEVSGLFATLGWSVLQASSRSDAEGRGGLTLSSPALTLAEFAGTNTPGGAIRS